jgi:hypothetical protein
MRIKTISLFAAIIGLAGIAGCFDSPAPYYGTPYYGNGGSSYSYWSPRRQTHEESEWRYEPKHTVCNAFGRNCMVCDADNDYCRRTHSWFD